MQELKKITTHLFNSSENIKDGNYRNLIKEIFEAAEDENEDDDDTNGAEVELTKLLPESFKENSDSDNSKTHSSDYATQVKNEHRPSLSIQLQHSYITSLGVYNLIGFDDSQQDQLHHQLSLQEKNNPATNRMISNIFNHGDGTHKNGTVATYFTLFKSFCGLGVLALPSAFRLAGYVGGTLGIIVIAATSYHCMNLLLQCAVLAQTKINSGGFSANKGIEGADGKYEDNLRTGKSTQTGSGEYGASVESSTTMVMSFGAIGEIAIGKIGSSLVDVCLVLSQVGFATAYLIFIGSNVFSVLNHIGEPSTYIFIAAVAVVPLVWLKDLKHLAFTSLLADAAILFGIITIFAYDLLKLSDGVDSRAKSLRMGTLPLFFGVAVFAFEGVGLILPVQQTMQRPQDMPGLLRVTLLILTVIFISIGALSYMAYGAATADMITLNLPRNGLVSTVQVFYSLGLFFTYPVMMFPACKILEATKTYYDIQDQVIHFLRSSSSFNITFSKYVLPEDVTQRAFRLLLVLGTATIAVITPHFTLFVDLIGSIACTMLAFVLPTIFYVKLVDKPSVFLYVQSAGIVLFGVVGGLICLLVTLDELYLALSTEH